MILSPKLFIKLVLSDMDGTILSPERTISSLTQDAVKTLSSAGIPLSLVSARPPESMLPYIRQLDLNGPCAGFNGGIIFTPDGQVKKNILFPQKVVEKILLFLTSYDIDVWFQNKERWSVRNSDTDLVKNEQNSIGVTPHGVSDLLTVSSEVNRIIAIGYDADLAKELEYKLGKFFEGEASVLRSTPTKINITPAQATKGNALHILAAMYGFKASSVACLGDAHNDLPMLQEAGLGIAMGQAPEEIKEKASCITTSNSEDGWAEAVERFIIPRVI